MSGHSKWSTIKRQKGITDQKRGQIFTKLSKAIMVAVRQGGGIFDPEMNFRLRLAIEKAREVNMPKDNINRAIERAAGKTEAFNLDEAVYEGYGPSGSAYIVRAVTDNRRRTSAEIKNIFDRNNGRMTEPGAVSYLFSNYGVLEVENEDNKDEIVLAIIDLGPVDVIKENGKIKVLVNPSDLMQFKKLLDSKKLNVIGLSLNYLAHEILNLKSDKNYAGAVNLYYNLLDSEDVDAVFINFKIETI